MCTQKKMSNENEYDTHPKWVCEYENEYDTQKKWVCEYEYHTHTHTHILTFSEYHTHSHYSFFSEYPSMLAISSDGKSLSDDELIKWW